MAAKITSFQGTLSQLEKTLDVYFGQKAPALPKNIREILVKIAPYLVLIGVIFSIPAVLALLGLGAIFTPLSLGLGVRYGYGYILGIVFLIVSLVLSVMALPGLFKRQRRAWQLMFYSSLLSAVHSLLILSLGSLIIGTLLSWYILFQVKSLYK